jgi:hypothetical protein
MTYTYIYDTPRKAVTIILFLTLRSCTGLFMAIMKYFTGSKIELEHKLHKCHTEPDRGPDRANVCKLRPIPI